MLINIRQISMKLIKISIIFIIVLFLSGCTAKYDLTINSDGTINECISGRVTNNELDTAGRTDISVYLENLNYVTPLINNEGEFSKKIDEKNNYKDFVFNYNYNGNYSKSNILNNCFENVDFFESEDEYIFNLSGEFYCLFSDKVEINLISAYAVFDSNADKIDGNKHTWIIENSDDVNISAIVSKNIAYSERKGTDILKVFRIIGFIIFAILLAITLFIYLKRKDNTTY